MRAHTPRTLYRAKSGKAYVQSKRSSVGRVCQWVHRMRWPAQFSGDVDPVDEPASNHPERATAVAAFPGNRSTFGVTGSGWECPTDTAAVTVTTGALSPRMILFCGEDRGRGQNEYKHLLSKNTPRALAKRPLVVGSDERIH